MKKLLRNLALGTVLVASCATYAAGQTTDRSQFAYGLQQVAGVKHNRYTVSFNASGDAKSAVLVLTNTETNEVVNVTLGEVKKGLNTFTLNLSETAQEHTGTFTWAIELHNYEIPKDIVTSTTAVGGNRAGVVCMVDPALESFGYTVIGRTKNGGFDIYDPQGTKVKSAIHKNNAAMGGTAANASCPMRAVQRGNTAQFASWGDKACGVVALDLSDLNSIPAPYNVLLGTNTGNGTMVYNGVKTGSGTPCVAYAGEGEGTILFTFDEDIFKNNIAANPIGTAMTTGKAAENWGYGGKLANKNVGLLGTKNGLFFSQTRENGMETGTPGLGYIDIATKEIVWIAADEAETDPNFLPSATGGIDINPAGDLFAISTYTGINVYHLSWDGNKPVLTPYKSIKSHQAGIYTTVKFDAGNNLHVINQTNGYYQVILANEESIITTPALAGSEIVLEEPTADDFPGHMYLVGQVTGWDEPTEANADLYANYTLTETEVDTKIYTGRFYLPNNGANYFRFYAALGGWNSTSYGPAADNGNYAIEMTDGAYEGPIYASQANFDVSALPVNGAGYYDFTVDLNTNTVKIDYEFSYTPPTFYLRGDINSWGTSLEMPVEGPEVVDGQYVYIYTASLENASGQFMIATANYEIEFGSQFPFENGVAADIWNNNKSNMTLPDGKYMTLRFVYDPTSVASQLTIDWLDAVELSRFAYDIKYQTLYNDATGKHYGLVTYKASGDGAHAYLIATPVDAPVTYALDDEAGSNEIVVDMGEAQAGENTYELDLDQFSYEHKYSFAIQLENNHEGLGTPKVFTLVKHSGTWARGGVVAMTDPDYPDTYGYVLVATASGLGIDVYDPAGNVSHYTNSAFESSGSAPLRGDQRLGKAVFPSWADPTSGLYEVDPLNPATPAVQLVEGERVLTNGTLKGDWIYNGVKTVSSTPTVCYVGKGENTMMWTFDEDIYANTIVGYKIGNAETVTIPATIICNVANAGWNSTALMLNKNVCFEPASNGFFSAQYRAKIMEAGVPAFVYVDNEGHLKAKSSDLFAAAGFSSTKGSNGAVALTSDEKILAVGTNDGVEFFEVEWNDNVPSLTHLWSVTLAGTNTTFSQAKFDAGNNLYIAGVNTNSYDNSGMFAIITLPRNIKNSTPAKAIEQNLIVSGVENVAADAEVEYEPVYYTLGGVQVAADQLTPGIYVKVVGPTATKVVVK